MPMSSKEMIRFLKKNGFEIVRQNGSHVIMMNKVSNKQLVVPYHGSRSLKKGIEQAILKQAGLYK